MISLSKYSEIYKHGVINYLRDKELLERPTNILCGNCHKSVLHEEKRKTSVDGICFRCGSCGKTYSHRMNSPFLKLKIDTDVLIDIILFAFLMKIPQKQVCYKHKIDKETVKNIYIFCRGVMKEEMDNYYKEMIFGRVNSLDLITDEKQYNETSHIIIDPNYRIYFNSPACEIDEVELGSHTYKDSNTYFKKMRKHERRVKINALGIYDRGTKFTKCFMLKDKEISTFKKIILSTIENNEENKTRIYTDAHKSYFFLENEGYDHYVINKEELQRSGLQRGGTGTMTTNHIESYFSEIQGTGVFKYAFQNNKEDQWELYLKEGEFRVLYKNSDLADIFLRCLKNTKVQFPSLKRVNNKNNIQV